MTEWTSISVTEEQKAALEDHKPDGMAMGAFLVSAIESNEWPMVSSGDVEFEPYADAEAIAEHLADALDRASIVSVFGGVSEEGAADLYDEIRKAQELAEQARDNTDELLREVR